MNLETKKVKSPFKPDSKYMSDLAAQVQTKVGIEKKEVFRKDKSVKIPSKRNESLQLSVEFGFPLTTEKSKPESKVEDLIIQETKEEAVLKASVQEIIEVTKPVFEDFPHSGLVLRREDLPQIEKANIEEAIEDIESEAGKEIVQETINELAAPIENEIVEEIEYDSIELDLLHEEMEKRQQSEVSTQEVYDTLENRSESSQTVEENTQEKKSWSIPWGSIFGAVASLVAVAAAWFVWTVIQKPMAIDDWADQNVVAANTPENPIVNSTKEEKNTPKEFQVPSLDTDVGLVYDLIVEDNLPIHRNIEFQELSEQGRISSVELEKEGLMVLELEDVIFDEIVLAP